MILFTSATKPVRSRQILKTTIVYLAVSGFCFLFAWVYSLYGHGVYSVYMTYMFLYPLLGGVLPFLLLWIFVPQADTVRHYRFCYNGYHSGIAALAVGSTLNGIFRIAGTSSPYTIVFYIVGWLLAGIGLAVYLFSLIARSRKGTVCPHA